ncbi:c42f2e4b-2fcf-4437-ac29-47625158b686 [Sclerotinia trifoliorum]|uniref:C42f2e4b-2fcf-4437-ac29-47625158b686 n=1 Tax=Sclerotinia trifoliorum TaxID=28548 RepID=A0A8H2VVY5_9HELO|nr:c42f2e4b-2fcf-4437-ac29-47625158b686 [Sclerotinia trifoliorum]
MAPSAIHNGPLSPLKQRQLSNGHHFTKLNGYQDHMPSPSFDQRSMTGSDYFQTTLLQDAIQKVIKMYRSELGQSSEKFLQSCKSIEGFFDYVATIRLSQMPHHGSRWDKILKWAEFFTGQFSTYSEEVSSFTAQSEQATNIIYASCKILLEMGPKFVPVLEKIFGVLYNCSLTLSFLVRHHELLHTVEELQTVLVACYADLLKLVTGVTIHYTRRQHDSNFSIRTFEEMFGQSIDEFFMHSDRFVDKIWSTRLERLAEPGDDSVEAVRKFLTPHDRVTRILATKRRTHGARADFTCEWFDRPLGEFLRSGKNLFMVTGSSGSGKSLLSEWVVERLQAFKGRRATEVIRYTIDGALKTELSTLSIVKGLLLQMLQLSAGDKALYKELLHAYELHTQGDSNTKVEDSLWAALGQSLRTDRGQTVVIDGFDQVYGGESNGFVLLDRLRTIVSKHHNTKCIIFSRPLTKPIPGDCFQLSIGAQHTTQDLQYFIESLLFSTMSLSQRESSLLTAKLLQAANGSYVWTQNAVEILKKEQTPESIIKRLDTLPKDLGQLLDIIVSSIDLRDGDTKSILAWLLASERPLLISEVKQLLEIDTGSFQHVQRATRIEDDITTAIGPLIKMDDGFVRFSHDLVKQNITQRSMSIVDFKNTGAFPFHIKEAHYDLALRSLAYVKATLTRRSAQLTFTNMSEEDLDELFQKYEFIQYASRYWIVHFATSPMNEGTQQKLTPAFKTCFADSVLMSLFEGSCWEYQFPLQDALSKLQLALSIRKLVLGETSASVLQTLLNIARLGHIGTSSNVEHYYDAWKLAEALHVSSIAFKCAQQYIERTSSITITKMSEVLVRKTELLEYIIKVQRSTDSVSQETITYAESLIQIYVSTHETSKVSEWQKYAYELNVTVYGKSASQTIKSWEIISRSSTEITKMEQHTSTLEQEYEISVRKMSAADSKRLELSWAMIEKYEKEKNTVKTEEILINLWQSLTSLTHIYDVSIQEKKIEVALRYVEFLRREQRIVEAEIILRGIHIDLEHIDIQSTTLIKHTKLVGDQLQSIGSVAAARLVFSNLWEYYVRTGRQESTEAKSVSKSLTQISETKIEETTWDVTTVREVFERTIVNKTTKTIDTTTIRQATSLCSTYYLEQRWSEITQVTNSTLLRIWPSFSGTNFNVSLPTNFTAETLDLLNRLAFAHFKLRQLDLVEVTYRKIFYAVIATTETSDELLESASKKLINFYESHSMTAKLIIIYRDLHHEIEKRHGKTHTWTIKTLYLLGDLSMQIYNITEAETAYRTIHVNLGNGNTEICHKDALRAALALCVIYEQQRQYVLAQKICSSLWHALVQHGKEYDIKSNFAEDLYHRYVRVVRQASETHHTVLRQLAVDFREACVNFYGVHNEVTIKSTLQLAELDEHSEQYREEAISMYEDADSKAREAPKGQITEMTLQAVLAAKKRLPHLYSISKLSTSTEAIALYKQELSKFHTEKGYAHRYTLLWLGHLTKALAAQDKPEATTEAQQTLQASVIEILKTEKNPQILSDSAATFATIYKNTGLESDAKRLMKQLRSQAVFAQSNLKIDPKIKLENHTWVFLVSFESTITGRKEFYSSMMADLFMEVFLHQMYQRSIAQKMFFTTVLSYASRLLAFLKDIEDDAGLEIADESVLEYFAANLEVKKNLDSHILREFLHIVLVNLNDGEAGISILQAGLDATSAYMGKSKFAEAQELAEYVDFFQKFYGGYDTLPKVEMGLRLALVLVGTKNKLKNDPQLLASSVALSRSIMKQIVKRFRSGKLQIVDLPIEQLNTACGLLGETQDLESLEWLLTQLWNSRHSQPSWSSSTIVHIGRLLVETQFSSNHQEQAIHLLEDMCYNVRRVWGALDSTTLEMQNLLSTFYTSSTNPNLTKAMRIHEDILRNTVSDAGDELPSNEVCVIAIAQLELLKRVYWRKGTWDKDVSVYVDLWRQIEQEFEDEHAWKEASKALKGVDKWSVKKSEKGEKDDELGIWKRPESFEFMTAQEGTRQHSNNLRKTSSMWGFSGYIHNHERERQDV